MEINVRLNKLIKNELEKSIIRNMQSKYIFDDDEYIYFFK